MSARLALASCLLAGALSAGCTAKGAVPFEVLANTNVTASAALGAALAIYLIYDPLAPNWEIEEARMSNDTYRLSMKMKRYHTGGAGESLQIFKRRATQLQLENGYANYQIMAYNEGIDSQTLGARRVAEGVLRLIPHEDADSYKLNHAY